MIEFRNSEFFDSLLIWDLELDDGVGLLTREENGIWGFDPDPHTTYTTEDVIFIALKMHELNSSPVIEPNMNEEIPF